MSEEKKNGTVAVQERRLPRPFEQIDQEFQDMRRRMADWFRRPFSAPYPAAFTLAAGWQPTADAYVKDNTLIVKAELPGVKQEDIEVNLTNGILTIAGHRKEEKETAEAKYYVAERFSGTFQRSFTLPDGVDAGTVTATFKDGILEVRAPSRIVAMSFCEPRSW